MPIAGYNPFAPLALRLPAAYVGPKNNAVDRLIQTSQKEGVASNPLDNPLYRKVDVWMLAIEVAVATSSAIPSTSDGLERFVDGTVLQNDPDRISLLEALAVSEVAAHAAEKDLEAEVHAVIGDPRRILDIANRYAAAGIEDVLATADPSRGKPLWQLADRYYDLAVETVGEPRNA